MAIRYCLGFRYSFLGFAENEAYLKDLTSPSKGQFWLKMGILLVFWLARGGSYRNKRTKFTNRPPKINLRSCGQPISRLGRPVTAKKKLIRKARTRFTYAECISHMSKEQFAGWPPRLSTRGE